MKFLLNIWLGLLLIIVACGVLLFSDLGNREGGGRKDQLPRIVIKQWTSTELLDAVVQGMTVGLREQGFVHGRTANISFLNALGDSGTANLMARQMTEIGRAHV